MVFFGLEVDDPDVNFIIVSIVVVTSLSSVRLTTRVKDIDGEY